MTRRILRTIEAATYVGLSPSTLALLVEPGVEIGHMSLQAPHFNHGAGG